MGKSKSGVPQSHRGEGFFRRAFQRTGSLQRKANSVPSAAINQLAQDHARGVLDQVLVQLTELAGPVTTFSSQPPVLRVMP